MTDGTRERLLDRARELYLEVGMNSLSLREVARRAGVSAPAVYRHFEDKDALVGAIVGEGFRTFHGYLMRALVEATPRERLRAAGRAYRAFALENAEHYRVLFMSSVTMDPNAKGCFPETRTTFQFLVDRVRECMDASVLRDDEPVALAATIWAHVHGLVSLRLTGHLSDVGDDAAFGGFFERSVDDLLRGLLPAAEVNSVSAGATARRKR